MFARLASLVIRRRRLVLVGAGLLLVVAGVFGGSVAESLSNGGFEDTTSESAQARRELEEIFGASDPNLLLLVTADGGDVNDPAVRQAGAALTAELGAEPGVEQAASYWTLGAPPPLRSRGGDKAIVMARVAGDEEEIVLRAEQLADKYTRDTDTINVAVGGYAEIFRQISETIESDLVRAEAIALPVTFILLLLVFGSLVSALLPVGVGVMAILSTFLILRLLTGVTEVSIYAINLTTALGLGLAIDYSLFIVSRFREELAHGLDPAPAVVRTLQTAGKTVAFSAVTVAVSLAALMVFPLMFLRSFAYAGIAVVTFAALGSLIVLPALLVVLGRRVDALRVRRTTARTESDGFWHRMAVVVMRRPLPFATAATALLLLLGAPFLNVEFGSSDDRILPPGSDGRVVSQQLRTEFSSREAGALSVVLRVGADPAAQTQEISDYATELSALDGVARVDALTGSYIGGRQVIGPGPTSVRFSAPDATWLSVVPNIEPVSEAGEALVTAVRQTPAPFETAVAGGAAELLDGREAVFSRVPLAAAMIGVVTFVVLFLMFGSLLVPAKAVVLNLLSLTATFGAMVWVFQEGHLAGVLNFTPTGTLDTTTPILMFCIAFGLSMDYEVFLLSRIKEEHDRGADNVTSVAVGLERTGGIVTAAAALIAVVFIAFSTSGITILKLMGVGMALAVIIDATLIRATLVPAFMRLAGRANWWAPASLRRIYERFGFSESEEAAQAEAAGQPALVSASSQPRP